jgi:hypothetical protein
MLLRFSLTCFALILGVASAVAAPLQAHLHLHQEELPLPAGEQMQLASFAEGPLAQTHLLWVDMLPGAEEGAPSTPVLRTAQWQGSAWTEAQEITRGRELFLNWADTPRMAVQESGAALVTWLVRLPAQEGGNSSGYGIRYRWRASAEAAWSESAWLHQDLASREHGFVTLLPLPDGSFQASFLQAGATMEDPTMLRSVIIHADGSKSAERLLDERVCDCCDTAGVVLPNGKTIVIYRNRSEEEMRDIHLVREDPLAPEEEQAEDMAMRADQWKTQTCPVNGPAITNQGRFVTAAWYTQFQGKLPQVKAVLSRSGGTRFVIPTILAGGNHTIGRVEAAYFPQGEVAVSWLEKTDDGKAQWVLRKIPKKGLPGPKQVLGVVPNSRDSGFLSMRSTETSVLTVWRNAKTKNGLVLKRLWLTEKTD